MADLRDVLERNREWAEQMAAQDPGFFERLAAIQTPAILWIGCSDSRVPANQITGHQPGEVFVHRNVANVVVHTDLNCLSVIQFAVDVLKIRHIIVCGHTDCAVMKAVLHPEEFHDLPAVKEWVGQAETTRRLMREHYTNLTGKDRLIKTTQENVRNQLEHLRTHPAVALQLRKGKVDLHGWVYSISTGDVWVYDFDSEQFTSLLGNSSSRLKAAR